MENSPIGEPKGEDGGTFLLQKFFIRKAQGARLSATSTRQDGKKVLFTF
jgi:hypothetical protein